MSNKRVPSICDSYKLERKALESDARAYRFLRENRFSLSRIEPNIFLYMIDLKKSYQSKTLDAAVAAAMKQSKEQRHE